MSAFVIIRYRCPVTFQCQDTYNRGHANFTSLGPLVLPEGSPLCDNQGQPITQEHLSDVQHMNTYILCSIPFYGLFWRE